MDPFVVGLVAMLLAGLVIPFAPGALTALDHLAIGAVAILFFFYGARLQTRDVINGLRHWRLQGLILAITFLAFPLAGLALRALSTPLVGHEFAAGILFITLLPSTVQSSVAMVSVAHGNVPGAICGATVSNILGMLLTPALVIAFMSSIVTGDANSSASTPYALPGTYPTSALAAGLGAGQRILLGLLAPFVAGQIAGRWIGPWVRAHQPWTQKWDQGTILLLVLGAVASATASGTWDRVTPGVILIIIAICTGLLALVLAGTWLGGRHLRFPREDRITLLFCGSTKSMATGLPIAAVVFPAAMLGPIAVPVIIYHQIQLMVISVIARRLSAQSLSAQYRSAQNLSGRRFSA